MEAFLGVAKGSAEKPWLLELRYNYTDTEEERRKGQDPVVLAGKGNNLLVSFHWLYLGKTLTHHFALLGIELCDFVYWHITLATAVFLCV